MRACTALFLVRAADRQVPTQRHSDSMVIAHDVLAAPLAIKGNPVRLKASEGIAVHRGEGHKRIRGRGRCDSAVARAIGRRR